MTLIVPSHLMPTQVIRCSFSILICPTLSVPTGFRSRTHAQDEAPRLIHPTNTEHYRSYSPAQAPPTEPEPPSCCQTSPGCARAGPCRRSCSWGPARRRDAARAAGWPSVFPWGSCISVVSLAHSFIATSPRMVTYTVKQSNINAMAYGLMVIWTSSGMGGVSPLAIL